MQFYAVICPILLMFGSLHRPVCFLMYFLSSFLLGCMYTSLCLRLSGRYGREGNHRHVRRYYGRGWCRSTSGLRPDSFIQQPAGDLFHAGAAEPAVVFVNSHWRHFRFRLHRRAVSGESRSSSVAGYLPSDSQLHRASPDACNSSSVLLEDDTSTPPSPVAISSFGIAYAAARSTDRRRPASAATRSIAHSCTTSARRVCNTDPICPERRGHYQTTRNRASDGGSQGYNVDVAVITETHLKKKHADHHVTVDGYALFRRDRVDRRGGGTAVYVNSRLSADVWPCPGVSAQFELL